MRELKTWLWFRYLAWHYLRRYALLLFSLSLLFALMNYFQNAHRLPEGANVSLLYLYLVWQEALGVLYPLVMVLAMLVLHLSFVKQNMYVALYAIGWTKGRIFAPILTVMLAIFTLFIFLHTTQFAYAKEKATLLVQHKINLEDLEDLFLKYHRWFIYVKRLDPGKRQMVGLSLFRVVNDRVEFTMKAAYATYKEPYWYAHDVVRKRHIYQDGILKRFEIDKLKTLRTLKGYKPQIIRSFYDEKALRLFDAFESWRLLESQGVSTQKIKSALYAKLLFPFFAMALSFLLFFNLGYHPRMVETGKMLGVSLVVIFGGWGILFWLEQLARNGVISPEAGLLTFVVASVVIAITVWLRSHRNILD